MPNTARAESTASTDETDNIVFRGVVAFVALTGGVLTGEEPRPSPLWLAAQAAGMTLDEFVDEIAKHTSPMVPYAREAWSEKSA